ncbi:MAG TPA: glycosyltransferase [Ktedonobacteraceae bacterium]|nr:glycosyltransferase [Ktedonobacteraceae bacterium]
MRILFVTPYVPSRIRVRPFNLIKSLSSVHEVSLVSLLCDEYEQEMVADVANYCASVDLVPLPKSQAYKNCLLALPTLTPLRVAYYKSPAFIERIQQVIHQRSIEVVHGELIKVAPALRKVMAQENIPLLYDSVDCISWYLQQQHASARNLLKKAFIFSELQKMRRYERQSLAAFDQVVITSSHDRDCLIALGEQPSHIKVVSNGVDIDYFTPPVSPREQDSLVFCAKLDYYPNSQAIVHFCHEILPHIWESRPRVRLTIVGNNPPQAVRDLGADERITVTGYVPDIRPYLRSASVALAPLRVAAGMQNKVLEALAMGTPVVATPGSCRSLQVKHQTHLLVAEEPRSFADAVLRLLENPRFAQDLGNAGRYYVEQYHSWVAAANTLSNLYSFIATGRDQQEHLSHPAYAL